MNIIFFVLKALNSLIPKSNKKILFISRPDFSDNAYYMYLYIKKQKTNKTLIWLIYDQNIYILLKNKGLNNIYYLRTFFGIWQYVTSKFIITSSSSLWQIKSIFQKQFDLWHGIPLKTIIYMGEKNIPQQKQAPNITMRFATSNLEKALLAASFNYKASKIMVTGQPRTDALFLKKEVLYKTLNIDKNKYKKIIFYMPTYRHGYKEKTEGAYFGENNIFRMEKYKQSSFLRFLHDNEIMLLFKLHPFEEQIYKDMKLSENILWITNELLIKNNIATYDILPDIDILITDYSSVYFDFLLLNKKIIFTPTDLEKYESSRGFQIEPYDFWAPGKKALSQEELQHHILSPDTQEEKVQREIIRNIMFKHQDSLSSERIYSLIKKTIEK